MSITNGYSSALPSSPVEYYDIIHKICASVMQKQALPPYRPPWTRMIVFYFPWNWGLQFCTAGLFIWFSKAFIAQSQKWMGSEAKTIAKASSPFAVLSQDNFNAWKPGSHFLITDLFHLVQQGPDCSEHDSSEAIGLCSKSNTIPFIAQAGPGQFSFLKFGMLWFFFLAADHFIWFSKVSFILAESVSETNGWLHEDNLTLPMSNMTVY